ncbi:54S ribosomal protein L28, mitochondrial [[Candida] jaroonii]|uniref:54S ribosomal protein L28, mitochondrial n=1 Tax=[Candida] jaroonii TaxID=467808 RepID=A0ACA9Y7Y4_9ASCO|nr:54S ribosomal protein L28, mitochondrial [[Candida] jaroonii]
MFKQFVRFKSISNTNASTQKVVNQLSALSASRKQPKLIKLSAQDLIKHQTIQNAWKLYSDKLARENRKMLKEQYESIYNAMEELKQFPELFEAAKDDVKAPFPLEMRIPTDFPPNQPWIYNYEK